MRRGSLHFQEPPWRIHLPVSLPPQICGPPRFFALGASTFRCHFETLRLNSSRYHVRPIIPYTRTQYLGLFLITLACNRSINAW